MSPEGWWMPAPDDAHYLLCSAGIINIIAWWRRGAHLHQAKIRIRISCFQCCSWYWIIRRRRCRIWTNGTLPVEPENPGSGITVTMIGSKDIWSSILARIIYKRTGTKTTPTDNQHTGRPDLILPCCRFGTVNIVVAGTRLTEWLDIPPSIPVTVCYPV